MLRTHARGWSCMVMQSGGVMVEGWRRSQTGTGWRDDAGQGPPAKWLTTGAVRRLRPELKHLLETRRGALSSSKSPLRAFLTLHLRSLGVYHSTILTLASCPVTTLRNNGRPIRARFQVP